MASAREIALRAERDCIISRALSVPVTLDLEVKTWAAPAVVALKEAP